MAVSLVRFIASVGVSGWLDDATGSMRTLLHQSRVVENHESSPLTSFQILYVQPR
jgi:hypothetical protein